MNISNNIISLTFDINDYLYRSGHKKGIRAKITAGS